MKIPKEKLHFVPEKVCLNGRLCLLVCRRLVLHFRDLWKQYYVKPNKCFLFQKSVQFLGHIVSDKGVSCDPSKVDSVRSWKVPSTVKELKSFLGLCNYYKKFIANYSTLAKPLTELTSTKVEFKWDENCQHSFDKLKELLVSAPILGYPKD